MARSPFQKLKLLYIMDFLLKYTDEDHSVTMEDILSHLEKQGISAERKSIYDDLEALRYYGLDIIRCGRPAGYRLVSRPFELAELKLLADSVECSKFITPNKTRALIKKIGGLASVHEAAGLNRQVYVKNRVKTMNESIYYNVDAVHEAISRDRMIRFRYFKYAVDKSRHFRRDGAWYRVSPYALLWDDENYYLVAGDASDGVIKHYRMDKMTAISLEDECRQGTESFDLPDMGAYSRKVFSMFAGDVTPVVLRFENRLVDPVIDRFGRDVMLIPQDDEHFTVTVDVAVSPMFFAWIFGFGTAAEIISPPEVLEEMSLRLGELSALYASSSESDAK